MTEGKRTTQSGIESRQAEIPFAAAAAMHEARQLRTARQFAELMGAELSPESSVNFISSLERVAVACFGQPWDQIKNTKIPVTPELYSYVKRQ